MKENFTVIDVKDRQTDRQKDRETDKHTDFETKSF